MMNRRLLAIVLALSLPGTLFVSHSSASSPVAPAEASIVDDGGLLAAVECLRGAGPCFGWGTDNCCGEQMVLGAIAAGLQAWWAVGFSVAHMYAYCF